jgi:hypothetical protein
VIEETRTALFAGLVKSEHAVSVLKYVEGALELLPQSFGDRFYVDAVEIQALSEALSQGPIRLSQMIVPRHDKEWGHATVAMPSELSGKHHVVELIYFPGEDHVDDINLLVYPFLCHELVHDLLFRDDSTFKERFEVRLNHVLSGLRLSSISDRGSTRTYATKIADDIHKVWHPSPTQKNWAHELAVDVITLWLCGPAYLAALRESLADPEINPYQIDQTYPSYEVRALSLINACGRLEWTMEVDDLKTRIEGWRSSKWRSKRSNHYQALVNTDLVKSCVNSALEACDILALPCCKPQHVDQIRESLRRGQAPEFGIELILAAWVMKTDGGESNYAEWQKSVIQTLLKSITR